MRVVRRSRLRSGGWLAVDESGRWVVTSAVTTLLSAGLMLAPVTARAGDASLTRYDGAIDAVFQKWNRPGVPGCTIGVRESGGGTIYRSYGLADLAFDIPNSMDSVFEAGSVSKQFTAAAVMLSVKDGKVALDDNVRKYLPELPDYGTPITVGQLLSHTNGLRDWESIEDIAGWPVGTRVYSNADVLAIASRQKSLNFRPGTSFSYTNTGYNLLAIIVRRVTGESLAQYSREHIFGPLGMDHTQWRDQFQRVVKGRAVAYQRADGTYEQSMPFQDDYGNGGLLTTVPDLLRWNDALSKDKLGRFVTEELERRARLADGREVSYARGLYVIDYHGYREISHSGATAGYRAWLARYPQRGLSIALLCNAGDAKVVELGHAVANLFIPNAATSPREMRLSRKVVAARAGLYISVPLGLPLKLEVQGHSLQVSHGPTLVPISDRKFVNGFETFDFRGPEEITVSDLEGQRFEYQRASAWRPRISNLKIYEGMYASVEVMATYRVVVSHGGLLAVPIGHPESAIRLVPLVRNTFIPAHNSHPAVEFKLDSTGHVIGFEMRDQRVYGVFFRRSAKIG